MSNNELTYGYDYGDEDIPEIDLPQSKANTSAKNSSRKNTEESYLNVEPLPESFRPRKDGPGGE